MDGRVEDTEGNFYESMVIALEDSDGSAKFYYTRYSANYVVCFENMPHAMQSVHYVDYSLLCKGCRQHLQFVTPSTQEQDKITQAEEVCGTVRRVYGHVFISAWYWVGKKVNLRSNIVYQTVWFILQLGGFHKIL